MSEPAPVRGRRQRRFALPTGVVLALTIFLPAVRGCSKDDIIYPIQLPMFWTPYVLGAIVAALALCHTERGLRGWLIAAQVVIGVTAGGMALATKGRDGIDLLLGLAFVGVGAAVVALWRVGRPERRAADVAIVTGALSAIWFGLWAFDPDGLIGVDVSFAASLAMVAAGFDWRFELMRAARGTTGPPRAS